MSFDRKNPADLLALKNEVNIDPIAMGYDVNGNTNVILDLLNMSANNVGAETGPDLVTAEKLLNAIFPESISSQDQFKIQLAFEISSDPNADLSSVKDNIAGLSPGLQTAIDGIIRPLSRAEVLFSNAITVYETVTITRDDWIAARDS